MLSVMRTIGNIYFLDLSVLLVFGGFYCLKRLIVWSSSPMGKMGSISNSPDPPLLFIVSTAGDSSCDETEVGRFLNC